MRITLHIALSLVAVLLFLGASYAQDAGAPTADLPMTDTGTVPTEPVLIPPATQIPLDTTPPQEPTLPPGAEPWTWQHQTQNRQGTVTNLHERTRNEDGSAYSYQHSMTRPNGSHTQLREYSQTEEGYQLMRQQQFYNPDGTLLREHATTVTGTDPYNYQRQMTHTFRDGRTMEQTFTRSYDGTTGTMQRNFIGPNGQVRQFERPWAPDDIADTTSSGDPTQLPTPEEVGLPTADGLGAAAPMIIDPLAPETPEPEKGLLGWLNPFKNRETDRSAGSSATARRSGFTIGSFGRSRKLDSTSPGQARKAAGLSNSSQMRTMKTKPDGPPSHAAASLPSKAGKKF